MHGTKPLYTAFMPPSAHIERAADPHVGYFGLLIESDIMRLRFDSHQWRSQDLPESGVLLDDVERISKDPEEI